MAQINSLLFIKMLTIIKAVRKANHAKTAAWLAQQFSTKSQITQDVQSTQLVHDFTAFELNNKYKGMYASKLPDFDASPSSIAKSFEALALPVTQETSGYERQHPFETAAKIQRSKADIYSRLQDNQCVFTNLPVECEQLSTASQVRQFLVKNVHKDIDVVDVKYLPAVTTSTQVPKWAYIIVTLGSKRQAHMVNTSLRNFWFGDQLLKIKMKEDASREVFDNRTIVIRGIANHINQSQILEIFNKDNSAVVGIELPVENINMADRLEDRSVSGVNSAITLEKERKFNQAKLAVQQSLNLDSKYKDIISNELGSDKLQQMISGDSNSSKLLESEKTLSLIRIVTRLQAEGIQVLNSKFELLKIRDTPYASVQQAEATQSLQDKILQNKPQLEKVMRFLKQSEVTAPFAIHDTVDQLLKLNQGEIAYAFDKLIDGLNQREQLIEQRIGDQLKHFGVKERVLFEQKDFSQELQDMPSIKMGLTPEEVISVNDQINFVTLHKNQSAELKFSQLMRNTLNPFKDPLWNEDQLRLAEVEGYEEIEKETEVFDPRLTRSVVRMFREGAKFEAESQEQIMELIKELQDNYDVPFDELYHREKNLVQAVIEADKALKAKEQTFKNLMEHEMLTESEANQITSDSLLHNEHKNLFEKGQKREEARILKNKLNEETATSYEFLNEKQQRLQSMVESGQITQSEYDQQVQAAREQETRNLGYCFITYSHSDEARMMLLQYPNVYLNGSKLEIDLKSNIDHSEMDFDFYSARIKNDARVIDEVKALRDARKELKEFEQNIDSYRPKNKKLTDFRNLAKRVIEGNADTTRDGPASQRTQLEEERLRAKIEALQVKYPHVDMSQLFATDKAEEARHALHKSAFASYKAYEFLKHGITKQPEAPKQKSEAKRRLEENDPYNFPELDATVAKVLSKDILQPRVVDHGDFINKSGRRFSGYTDREFIESYFGKDLMRNAVVDRSQDPLFNTQQTLKEKYPMSMFLKLPQAQKKMDQLLAIGLQPTYDQFDKVNLIPNSQNPELAAVSNEYMAKLNSGELFMDRQHPTDNKRTYLKDLEAQIASYESQRNEKKNWKDTWDMNEISKIRQDLAEEYGLNEKDWFTQMKRGKFKSEVVEEEAEDESASAKFQSDYDLDPLVKKVNSEFVYSIHSNPSEHNAFVSDTFKKAAEKANQTPQQATKSLMTADAPIKGADASYGGKWFAQHEAGSKPVTTTQTQLPNISGRSLESFINDKENDENDIYEQYQRKINQRAEASQPQFKIDQEMLHPDMPRLESYFNTTAQGIHPFDQITDKVNEHLKGNQVETEEDRQVERELYQRELLGRLMGERLTPRQFEVITGQYSSADVKLGRVKNQQQAAFLDRRDVIRLQQESAEKLRRQKVMRKEWTEEESHEKLQQLVNEFAAKMPGPEAQKKLKRQFEECLQVYLLHDNPERIFEKEYYFDETLGQSLNEHVHQVKEQNPGMTVQTRRDRDGFAIVKTSFAPEYKYNLDQIEAFDFEQSRAEVNKTIDTILSSLFPENNQKIIENVANNMEKSIGHIIGEQQFELDAWTKLKVQSLVKAKTSGAMQTSEVIQELFKIASDASHDKSKPLSKVEQVVKVEQDPQQELFADRERFRVEIFEQLMKRIRKHQFMTQRKESDFVKPRVDEVQAYKGQTYANDLALQQLESKLAKSDSQSQDFDKNAFEKMKEEINKRKEAKEWLLSQGMPEFKAYLRF